MENIEKCSEYRRIIALDTPMPELQEEVRPTQHLIRTCLELMDNPEAEFGALSRSMLEMNLVILTALRDKGCTVDEELLNQAVGRLNA